MPTSNRPVLHKLSFAAGPERAVDDPRLAALASEGWTVGASYSVAVPGPDGEVRELHLILWPPRTVGVPWRVLLPVAVVLELAHVLVPVAVVLVLWGLS